MKTKNKKMSIIIMGICAVLLCVLGVSIYHLTKKDNNNEADYYLYINEDLVKDTYYYGEDFEFAQNMNIATLCKKESSNTVYASSLSDGKNKKGQEIDNKDLVVEGFNSDTHGKKAVKISYKQYSEIIEVDVKNCSITSIRVISESHLFVGEKVDKLELEIKYSDGHTIYDEYNHLGIDTSTTGTKTKTIYYPSYSIDWEYKVHEFDENCLDLCFVENFSYPYGYDDEDFLKGAVVFYLDNEFNRTFPLYGKFDGSTLGEQIANFKVKKSDVLNDPNNTDEVIIPYLYTVKKAKSITCTSPDWFGVDNIPTYFEVIVSMDDINYPNQLCKVPIQLTKEQSKIGTHIYQINFAGKKTYHTYTIVGIESVEAEDWEDVYYYDKTKTKEKIISNTAISTSGTSSSNTNLKYYLEESYDGLDIENLHYEILNEDLTNISKIKSPPIYDGENVSYYSSFFNANLNLNFNTNLNLYVSSMYYDSVPIKINYSNGESRIGYSKQIYDNAVIDCSKLGKQTLTLEYMGKTFNYTYKVKQIDSINVLNIDNVYENDVPTVIELKVKAKDGTFNIAKADIVGYFVKNKKISLYFEYLGEYYKYSTNNTAIKELICNDELVFEKNQKNITVNFTIKYADDTEKETIISFDNTQIDTSKPIENAKLNFTFFGKYYTFEYDVLDYTIEVKDASKTIYQYCPEPKVEYIITYSNGNSISKSYYLYNQVDTSTPTTMMVNIVDGIYKFSYELTILPLGEGSKITCINNPTYIVGHKEQVRLQILDASNNPLYTVRLTEYLDTSEVENNIEKTFTYCGMTCTYTYNVVDIGYIVFNTPQVYFVGSQLHSLRFTVYSEGVSSYTATLNKVDLNNFDLSESTLGFNILTFTYCGYEIDFVYYYGENGNVELLQDNFTIEIPKDDAPQNPPFIVLTKNTHVQLTIPMLITIGDYQFVDTSVNISMEIDQLKEGTYTYKFMYDDQEFEITYTIVDAE